MTKEQPFSATFKLEKETKNTVRYAEEAEGRRPVVGTVYIDKNVARASTSIMLAGKSLESKGRSAQARSEERSRSRRSGYANRRRTISNSVANRIE